MNSLRKMLIGACALLLPAAAQAQALSCTIPGTIAVPHPELPSAEQPKRVLPIGGYTLAITWAPEYCQANRANPSAALECGGGNRFGFTLHGLWPDGEGAVWPQYCAATEILSPATIRPVLCSTPSPQLVQHEWAKHGTCMGTTPANYFAMSTKLFAGLRYPDMNALSRRRGLTAGVVAAEIARANPGISADMMRVTANKKGWLDEIWFCLDKERRFHACPAHQGGLAPTAEIKIWRGSR